jgi:hypothetical protein
MKQMSETPFANAHGPVVFPLAHDLETLRVNDVDVADNVGAVVAEDLDPDPAVDALPNHPVQHQLFAVILVKLNQTDVTKHRRD